ncbi:MAG: hypothetical protein A2275_05655 [Bacteroidetes bacterium RIFOXYA12_FULL_35_11]|nr:MAG: hypothetical protein A2X01_10815 [Bacteroidetes bacterium GWF2_35_48]OFY74967.1 MAG: hypothetical protein A2275_05655 [Bacteroidetes bacterium RIFOXYA12_FULL_35_11]OFY92679.1 MAG: hypothetical protein A2491_02155 [Bacteroidetes bacterium RIFOXYC12_FULL_35_7]HBX53203.1 hypothetical protein [Bacteroidales bacterium]
MVKGLNFLFILVFYVTSSSVTLAQNAGVAQELVNYIDQFTGNFRYNVPLMNISGSNGENIPLVVNYNAGISTNQPASWVGLGWDLDIGEIKRTVNGFPDDWNGQIITSKKTGSSSEIKQCYGPLYFSNFQNATGPRLMDVYQSEKGCAEKGSPFEFPDYDAYSVSGPGISGEMSPHLFDYATIVHDGVSDNLYTKLFTKRAQFRLKAEPGVKIASPVLPNWTGNVSYLRGPNYVETDYTSNCPTDDTKLISGNYIEYFTNNEIANLTVGKLIVPPSSEFNRSGLGGDDIGAFKITNTAGFTYHYSLPVYVLKERFFTYWDEGGVMKYSAEYLPAYVTSWKLVAVTGPDFIDKNSNNYPDVGDAGFWITYHYSKWTDNFNWRNPFYGGSFDLYNKKNITQFYRFGRLQDNYFSSYSSVDGISELYYIEQIKTADETAVFIKDVRLDEHSANQARIPKLLLKNILLFNTKDFSTSLINKMSLTSTAFSSLPTTQVYGVNAYLANETAINNLCKKNISFNYNYSLSKNLYNNINYSNCSSPDPQQYYFNPDVSLDAMNYSDHYNFVKRNNFACESTNTNSGKITLLSITTYDRMKTQINPDINFEYAADNHNPFYNHEQHDFFGYYKKNYNPAYKGRYLIDDDKDFIDCWSLKKIVTPIGGVIEVDYESDVYNKVTYESSGSKLAFPKRILPIKTVVKDGNYINMTFQDPEDYNLIQNCLTSENIIANNINIQICCNSYFHDNNAHSNGGIATLPNGIVRYNWQNPATDFSDCTGNLPFNGTNFMYFYINSANGGGLRVKNISISEPTSGEKYKLSLSYEDGVLTTEPDRFGPIYFGSAKYLNKNRSVNDRHALPPMVAYSKVKVNSFGDNGNLLGSVVTKFENNCNLEPSLSTTFGFSTLNPTSITSSEFYTVTNDSKYGLIQEISSFNNKNSLVSKIKYEYATYEEQGRLEEIFYRNFSGTASMPIMLYPNTIYQQIAMQVFDISSHGFFKKIILTPYLKRIVNSIDNTTIIFEVNKLDVLSGEPVETTIIDPTQKAIYKTVQTPAYLEYGALGPKCINNDNLNKLSPTSLIKKYSIVNGNQNLIDGSYTTWTNSINVSKVYGGQNIIDNITGANWFPYKSFIFNGAPDYTNWLKISENTLYNEKIIPVETKAIGDSYSSVKYSYDNKFKIAEISNCNYISFAFSGFENKIDRGSVFDFEGGFLGNSAHELIGSSFIHNGNSIIPHSGEFCLRVPGSSTYSPGFTAKHDPSTPHVLDRGRTYRASVWVNKYSSLTVSLCASLNGSHSGGGSIDVFRSKSINNADLTIGDWKLLTIEIDVPEDYVSQNYGTNDLRFYVSGNEDFFIDDFRVHPIDAPMKTFVYDKSTDLLISELNNDNLATFYIYDAASRLIETKIESLNSSTIGSIKTISMNKFHYARLP